MRVTPAPGDKSEWRGRLARLLLFAGLAAGVVVLWPALPREQVLWFRLEDRELVRALHPTPAMGILPRSAENLAALHAWRRQLEVPDTFGAPFGVS